jgi:hypothetical protein
MTLAKIPRILLLAIGVISCWPGQAQAQFNGHNGLGDYGLLSGSQPEPGFYALGVYFRYGTDLVRNQDGESVGFDTTDPGELTAASLTPMLFWVTDRKILGGNYGAIVYLPVANLAMEVPILDRKSKTGTALGDLYVQPVNLGWHRDRADFTAGLGFFAPTGRYEADADDNVGLGMWSFEISGGTSVFLDQARSWHLATTAFYEIHGGKKDSDAKVGDILSLEGGLGKSFMEGAMSIGAAYYAQWKVTEDDFGTDFELPSDRGIGKHRVFGFGPEITVPLATSKKLIALVNVRYLWETGARTKTEGQTLAITATFPVPSIPLS